MFLTMFQEMLAIRFFSKIPASRISMSPGISYLITGSASILVVHTPPASDYLGPLLKMQIPRLIEAMLNQNPGEYDSCTLMTGSPSDFYPHQKSENG